MSCCYQLVIVEDEENTRRGLVNFVPWNELGFKVVGDFADGSDALEYLQAHPCDVVMTDIMMARMNGLEMIAEISKFSPKIKTIILSGYSDFSYAKHAIRYRVVDYLLKPIDEEELCSVFERLKEQLDKEVEERSQFLRERCNGRALLAIGFWRNLLSGGITRESEFRMYQELLGFTDEIVEKPIFVYDCKLENQDVCEWVDEKLYERFISNSGQFLYCVLREENARWRLVALSLKDNDINRLKRHCINKVQAFVSEVKQSIDCEVSFTITHAVQNMKYLFAENQKCELEQQQLQLDDAKKEKEERILFKYKLFIAILDLGGQKQVAEVIDDLRRDFMGEEDDFIRFVLKNFYSMIEVEYKRRGIDVRDITGGKFDYNHLYFEKGIDSMLQCMKVAFQILQEALEERKNSYNFDVIGKIMGYVEKNLAKDLSHITIAQLMRINPAYMSRIFKQKTGENLSDYIMRLKMENAILLLKNGNYQVQDIAKMLGFDNPAYLSVLFKKNVGYTPLEYCRKIMT